MTDIAVTSAVERIARVIAAESISPNGDGSAQGPGGVSQAVDVIWSRETDRALAILRTLREPTPEMVAAGHNAGAEPAAIWNAMVRAAIEEGA